jgi:hypothetical protein
MRIAHSQFAYEQVKTIVLKAAQQRATPDAVDHHVRFLGEGARDLVCFLYVQEKAQALIHQAAAAQAAKPAPKPAAKKPRAKVA